MRMFFALKCCLFLLIVINKKNTHHITSHAHHTSYIIHICTADDTKKGSKADSKHNLPDEFAATLAYGVLEPAAAANQRTKAPDTIPLDEDAPTQLYDNTVSDKKSDVKFDEDAAAQVYDNKSNNNNNNGGYASYLQNTNKRKESSREGRESLCVCQVCVFHTLTR